MPYLFHDNKEDVRLLDCEGRTHIFPPNKAVSVLPLEGTDIPGIEGQPAYRTFTIPADKMAKYWLNEGKHFGLVQLEERITDNGIQFLRLGWLCSAVTICRKHLIPLQQACVNCHRSGWPICSRKDFRRLGFVCRNCGCQQDDAGWRGHAWSARFSVTR